MNKEIPAAALSLAALSIEYCKVVAGAETSTPRNFLREVLRYLPRFYVTMSDLHPYGDDEEDSNPNEFMATDAIYSTVEEEQYDAVREIMAKILGENDMYLDTSVDDMRYSDTPVAVSLAEKLADIFQNMADIASTIGQASPEMIPEILADVRYRFATFLSDTICSALRAANYIYYNADLNIE